MEREVLGFYLTCSPFDNYSFKSLDTYSTDKYACIGGEISALKIHVDKNKNKMAFITISTQYGNVEAIMFAKQYAVYGKDLAVGNLFMVEGIKDGGTKIKINKMTQIA